LASGHLFGWDADGYGLSLCGAAASSANHRVRPERGREGTRPSPTKRDLRAGWAWPPASHFNCVSHRARVLEARLRRGGATPRPAHQFSSTVRAAGVHRFGARWAERALVAADAGNLTAWQWHTAHLGRPGCKDLDRGKRETLDTLIGARSDTPLLRIRGVL
jgi:hypothetical protein